MLSAKWALPGEFPILKLAISYPVDMDFVEQIAWHG